MRQLGLRSPASVYRELILNSPQLADQIDCNPGCCTSLLNPPSINTAHFILNFQHIE